MALKLPKAPVEETPPAARFHRLRLLEFEGGFLGDCKFEFDDYLSCLIGGRGTGKTTVIEVLRWVLDHPTQNAARAKDIEKLLRNNLGNGKARLKIETQDGVVYFVERALGDEPHVFTESGDETHFSLKKGFVVGVDIYGQNEIEQVADDPRYQLELIDKFVRREVNEIGDRTKVTVNQLLGNANDLEKLTREIDELRDQTTELPDVIEKLKGFAVEGSEQVVEEVRREQNNAVLRKQEMGACEEAGRTFAEGIEGLGGVSPRMVTRMRTCFPKEVLAGPNSKVLTDLRDQLRRGYEEFDRKVNEAVAALKASVIDISESKRELERRHAAQDKRFRELLDKHEQEKGRARERGGLVKKQGELLEKQKRLEVKAQEIAEKKKAREQLLLGLSHLRDERFAVRKQVADMLNQKLGPAILVRIEQFGDSAEYKRLLTEALKGSQLKYTSLIEKIVERFPPHELVLVVQRNDRKALEDQLEVDGDRAARILLQLQAAPLLHDIEVVDLADRPVIQLLDGDDYKDSGDLSTGQKCTTVLPILLLESERPLIIDQPEDNLDNAFIYQAIVKSIRSVKGGRQLIFVTHNPNIPVLGDAPKVFVLESTGKRARIKAQGNVDSVRTDITTLLEGGSIAFEERMKRYGY